MNPMLSLCYQIGELGEDLYEFAGHRLREFDVIGLLYHRGALVGLWPGFEERSSHFVQEHFISLRLRGI